MTNPAPALDSKAVAEALDISAKELRVYLRATGYEKTDGRYVFTKANVTALRKGYAAWSKEREAARAAKVAASKADTPTPADDAS